MGRGGAGRGSASSSFSYVLESLNQRADTGLGRMCACAAAGRCSVPQRPGRAWSAPRKPPPAHTHRAGKALKAHALRARVHCGGSRQHLRVWQRGGKLSMRPANLGGLQAQHSVAGMTQRFWRNHPRASIGILLHSALGRKLSRGEMEGWKARAGIRRDALALERAAGWSFRNAAPPLGKQTLPNHTQQHWLPRLLRLERLPPTFMRSRS